MICFHVDFLEGHCKIAVDIQSWKEDLSIPGIVDLFVGSTRLGGNTTLFGRMASQCAYEWICHVAMVLDHGSDTRNSQKQEE